MLSILKKPTPVEVIHAEFDSAQDRILDECDKILAELQIPTETQLEKKANMLEELGFINSEVVHQAKNLKEKAKQVESQINLTQSQAESIRYFKQKYPFEKFITVDELNRICEKYNLIHAPAKNYIKDIPEKNVLEIKNCRKLENIDKKSISKKFEGIKDPSLLLNWLNKSKMIIGKEEIPELAKRCNYDLNSLIKWYEANDNCFTFILMKYGVKVNPDYNKYNFSFTSMIDKSGLFVAAPKSHFNLDSLTKKTKFGFFNVTVQEVKDPVVFEYCKNDICRIITKWGTDDDQSYLDPSLINETLN